MLDEAFVVGEKLFFDVVVILWCLLATISWYFFICIIYYEWKDADNRWAYVGHGKMLTPTTKQ